jgi:hypothetical protein
MTDIRDEVAAALRDALRVLWNMSHDLASAVLDGKQPDDIGTPDWEAANDEFDAALRGLTVVREGDCHCAERNVTHGRGCPCGNLARQPEGPR